MSALGDVLMKMIPPPARSEDVAPCLHELAVALAEMGLPNVVCSGAEAVIEQVTTSWQDGFRPTASDIMKSAAWAAEHARPVAPGTVPTGSITLRTHTERLRDREKPPLMLVAGMLPVCGVGALVALPGVGKTLVGIELARAVSSGDSFAGRAVVAGRVIYACPDSPASTERRMLAVPEDAAGRILTLCDLPAMPASLPDLRAAIESANANGDPIRLVVIDTWDSARTHSDGGYAGQDGLVESIMGELRRMASDLALAVVLVHHATRGDTGRARGSLVFDARADFIGIVEGDGSSLRLTATKCRDGERGPIGAWRIVPVEVAGAMVPTLVPADMPRPEPPSDGADATVLHLLVTRQPAPSADAIAKHLGMKGKGQVSRVIDRLRTAGLVAGGTPYRATEAGVQAVNEGLSFDRPQRADDPPLADGIADGCPQGADECGRYGISRASAADGIADAGLPSAPSTHIECGGMRTPTRRTVEL